MWTWYVTLKINQNKTCKVLKTDLIKVVSLKVYFKVDHRSHLYVFEKKNVVLNAQLFVAQLGPAFAIPLLFNFMKIPILHFSLCYALKKTTNCSGDAEDQQLCKSSSHCLIEDIAAQNV